MKKIALKNGKLLLGFVMLLLFLSIIGSGQEPQKKTQIKAAIGGGASLKINSQKPIIKQDPAIEKPSEQGINQSDLTPGELKEDIIFNGTRAAERVEPIEAQRKRLEETFTRLIQNINNLSLGNSPQSNEIPMENPGTNDSQGTSNSEVLESIGSFTETGNVMEPNLIKDKGSEYYSDLIKIDSELEETLKDAGSETITVSDDFPQNNIEDEVSVNPLPEKPEEADNNRLKRLEDKINKLYEKLGNENGDIVF